jgi:hypothetical protein
MVPTSDALELLLPGAPEALLRRARNVVQCLRLLAADAARPARCRSGSSSSRHARTRAAGSGARTRGPRSHPPREERPRRDTADRERRAPREIRGARVLDEFREDHPWLAGIPAPRDTVSGTAGNLIESAERLGLSADDTALWKGRLLRFTAGARAAEAHVRSRLDRRPSDAFAAGSKRISEPASSSVI